MSYVAARSLFLLDLFLLEVNRESYVSHSMVCKRDSAGQVSNVFDMCRSHDPFVKNGDIHEELVERNVLLSERADEVVKLQSGDCQYRLVVEFGVVEPVQEMN